MVAVYLSHSIIVFPLSLRFYYLFIKPEHQPKRLNIKSHFTIFATTEN